MNPNRSEASETEDGPFSSCERDRLTRDSYDRFAPRYTERYFETRALDAEMDTFLNLLPPSPLLLDAGCGPAHQARYFDAHGAFAVALDYSLKMLAAGHARDRTLRLVQGDMTLLPFRDRQFHGIWARASLIHMDFPDHLKSLKEFHRVLRPGGFLYAAVRRGDGEEYREETQQGTALTRYFRFWQPEQWQASLHDAGFSIHSRGIEEGEPEDWLWVIARRYPSH